MEHGLNESDENAVSRTHPQTERASTYAGKATKPTQAPNVGSMVTASGETLLVMLLPDAPEREPLPQQTYTLQMYISERKAQGESER